MKGILFNILKCLVILVIVAVVFAIFTPKATNSETNNVAKLTIYGDNVDKSYSPIIRDDKIYLSFDTISTFIDEEIYYDSKAEKIVITNENFAYRFKINSKKAKKNLTEYTISDVPIIQNSKVYLCTDTIKDIYNLKVEYDGETETLAIDRLSESDIHLNYNDVKVYSDIDTSSEVVATLNKENTVVVYVDSLKHKRWYKVKTDTGKIGYIEKSAVTVSSNNEEKENNNTQKDPKEKLIMFWQYGSKLDTLGEKIDGVNVAMPTWFSLADVDGTVNINYSKEYYNKVKEYGYEIHPIITNGFDSEDVSSKELTSELLNNYEARENLISNIAQIIKDYRLDGINIDFESMKEEDKYLYTEFLRELYPVVKEAGATLTVDIYFTNYIDRKGVGKACDYVILMGYDQRGNWSKTPGSIAEVKWTDENIKSLINDSNIPSSKIILGVPFYTRLWIEEDGEITTKAYTMENSNDFLKTYNLSPTYDNISGQNYVAVENKGAMYKLWIEDATSMSNRADVVLENNLAGVAAWQKGYETPDIWQVLREKLK